MATDPQSPSNAYLSYYPGGLRSLEIRCQGNSGKCSLVEVGGYLDAAGNNFWGVETFVRDGQTIILGSDREQRVVDIPSYTIRRELSLTPALWDDLKIMMRPAW